MKYEEFKEIIKREMKERFGDTKTVIIKPVVKNNSTIYDGLIIIDPNHNVSPTIYLEYYYQRYEDGVSIEDIIEDIMIIYKESLPTKEFDSSIFMDFNKAKSRVIMKLINTKQNQKLLEQIPYVPFYDLSIVFMVDVSQAMQERATILIYNNHMKFWDVGVEELYQLAIENTPRQLQPRLDDLQDVVEYIIGESLPFLEELGGKILTNHLHIHGATCMVYPELLKEIYDIFEDKVIIIPSSIHEVLVFPEKNMPDEYGLDYLRDMVKYVNENDLASDEILSDHVYCYDGVELINI